MKIWITGAGGFIGQHLTDLLVKQGHKVLATYFHPTTNIKELNPEAEIQECDIRDKEKVFHLIRKFQPDKIFHFAAQSYPTVSWENPWYTIETNILGTTNIFEAVKTLKPDCKILNAGSSGEYGFVKEEEVPIKESQPLNPLHPYGVTKLAQEKLAYQYFKNFNIPSVTIRIFNTTGPKKVDDVCADFTKRLIEIEKGIKREKKLIVGNLETRRAITDVRDTIRAFILALDKATPGETYNVSGEKVYKMSDIVDILRTLVDFEFETEASPSLLRPTDESIIYGDSTKFKQETGWQQQIPLQQTLKDMLDYWRQVL